MEIWVSSSNVANTSRIDNLSFLLFPFFGKRQRKYISIVAEKGEKKQALLPSLKCFVLINLSARETLYSYLYIHLSSLIHIPFHLKYLPPIFSSFYLLAWALVTFQESNVFGIDLSFIREDSGRSIFLFLSTNQLDVITNFENFQVGRAFSCAS